jgi:hypothetical protein
MFNPIVVVLECAACVVWRIDEDALNLAGEFLFEGFKREKVIAENELIIEDIMVGNAVR